MGHDTKEFILVDVLVRGTAMAITLNTLMTQITFIFYKENKLT